MLHEWVCGGSWTLLREHEVKPIKMQIAKQEYQILQIEPNQGNSAMRSGVAQEWIRGGFAKRGPGWGRRDGGRNTGEWKSRTTDWDQKVRGFHYRKYDISRTESRLFQWRPCCRGYSGHLNPGYSLAARGFLALWMRTLGISRTSESSFLQRRERFTTLNLKCSNLSRMWRLDFKAKYAWITSTGLPRKL